MHAKLVLCCLGGLFHAALLPGRPASAQDTLSVDQVIALAMTRAPQVLEAETRVQEARGRLIGARAWRNPEVEVVTGTTGGWDRRTEAELTLPVGPGLKRSRRVRAATAEMHSEEMLARDVKQRAVAAALAAHFQTLHAQLRREVARRRLDLADQLAVVARERVSSGDAAQLDTEVAEVELSRARSGILVEEQDLASSRADLALLLGLPSPSRLVARGDLSQPFTGIPADSLDLEERPDVLAAESRVAAATAERSLAGLGFLPDLAFRLNYEREGDATAWMPGLALTVPLFDHGQGERAQAQARLDRSQIERDRIRAGALAEYETARQRYQSARAAVEELRLQAVPGSDRVEVMVEESYRAGKTDLGSLLVLRRDALETRREYVDRQLEAALSGIELALAAGQWSSE